MRRLLLTSLITLSLVIGATGAAPVAYAEDQCPTDSAGNQSILGSDGECHFFDGNTEIGTPVAPTYAEDTLTQQTVDKAAAESSLDLPPSPEVGGIFAKVMTFIMGLFASLLGIAMVTLNYAVYYTVIKMGDYVHSLDAIGVTWRILRDVANIMFIFGFIGAGIATILNVDQFGWKTKMLPMLFVGAIFLNFSLFITEAMIDGTNLFATQFYTQINNGQQPTADTLLNHGISDKIMQQLGLQTMYDARTRSDILTAKNSVYIAFMGIILFIVTAFVMFSLAFILFARFVALIFFIILCPVAFMGLAIPQMQPRASQWWKNFLEQIITAPVLMLLLYVALAVITDASFLSFGARPDWKSIVPLTDGSINLGGLASAMLSFIVAIGLLLVVVIKAKSMSAFGAGMAIKGAAAASFGATAYGMSALAGGGAFGLRKGLQRYAPNSRTARIASNYLLRPLEKAKFDIRSAGLGKALGAMTITDASAPVGASTVGRVKQGIEGVRKMSEESNREHDQETRLPRLRAALAANDEAVIAQILGNMSDKELEMASVQRLLANPANSAAVASLAQNRFDKLMTSDILNDAQKNNLRTQRRNGLQARYGNVAHLNPRFAGRTTADVALNGAPAAGGLPAVRGLSSAQRAQLDSAILVQPHVMDLLNASDFTSIARRGELSAGDQATMGAYILGVATAPVPAGAVVPPRQASLIAASANPAFRTYYGL